MTGGDLYASPDGLPSGQGTLADPVDLATGMSNLLNGGTLHLLDGIYEVSSTVTFGKTNQQMTYQAADGARPVLVNADGFPPSVTILSNTTLDSLWFGGARPESDAGSRTCTIGQYSLVQDCTFFGYINAMQNGSDAHGNIYRRNRFVNCGYQLLSHPLYVSNLNSSLPEHGVLAEENIMVGCEGYSVHYYHEPSYGLAQYNFIGDALWGLALQGDAVGPVSGNRNIIWTVANAPLYRNVVSGTCSQNVWRGTGAFGTPQPDAGNIFVDPAPTAGSNPVVWQESDVASNLGNSSANIDTAIAALETAFSQTVAEIQADATIETHFATLKNVIDTWKLAP